MCPNNFKLVQHKCLGNFAPLTCMLHRVQLVELHGTCRSRDKMLLWCDVSLCGCHMSRCVTSLYLHLLCTGSLNLVDFICEYFNRVFYLCGPCSRNTWHLEGGVGYAKEVASSAGHLGQKYMMVGILRWVPAETFHACSTAVLVKPLKLLLLLLHRFF